MRSLHVVGLLLQIVALVLVVFAVISALSMPAYYAAYYKTLAELTGKVPATIDTGSLITYVLVGGTLAGLLLFAFGGICHAQADTAESAQRSAAALELLVSRRSGQSSPGAVERVPPIRNR